MENTIRIFIGCVGFLLALLLNVMFNMPMIMVVAFASVIMLFLPLDALVCYVLFITPFSWLTPGYLVLIAFVILILKSRKLTAMQIVPGLIIMFVEIVNVSLYDFSITWAPVMSYCSFIGLFFYLLFYKSVNNYDNTIYLRSFLIGVTISLCVNNYILLSYYDLEILLSGALRTGIVEAEETRAVDIFVLNANSAAYYSITLLSCLFLGPKKLKMNVYLYICLLSVAIVSGLLSFSRTWVLVLIVICVLYILFEKIQTKLVAGVMISILMLILLSSQWVDQIIETFTTRFDNQNFETAGGRTELFAFYNDVWMSNMKYMLIGTGATFYKLVTNGVSSIHNGIQQIYVCQGLLGLFIYVYSAMHYHKHFKVNNIGIISYLPVIAVFLFGQSLQFLLPQFLMFPILGAAYVLRINYKSK